MIYMFQHFNRCSDIVIFWTDIFLWIISYLLSVIGVVYGYRYYFCTIMWSLISYFPATT